MILAVAASARADFIYTFSSTGPVDPVNRVESFVFRTPTLISGDTNVAFADLESCTALTGCSGIIFFPNADIPPPVDLLDFLTITNGGNGFSFPLGAFAALGSYTTIGELPATLQVTAAAVPEPSSLLVMLAGLAGLMMALWRRSNASGGHLVPLVKTLLP
jgi:hypothetical protein